MDQFVLEKDSPGHAVSFGISSDAVVEKLSRGETITINYRHLYKRLTGRKRSSALAAVSSNTLEKVGGSATSLPVGNKHMMRSSNTFENVIDKLERKYYINAPIEEADSNSSGTRSAATGTPNSHAANSSDQLPSLEQRSKRKKKALSDTYDYSDPWLDDSGEAQEYEGRQVAKRRKAGAAVQYVVSSGNVEFEDDVFDDQAVDGNDLMEVEHNPSVAAETVQKEIAVNATISVKQKPPPAPKPTWSPTAAILTAMEQFQEAAKALNLNKNSGLPVTLEEPLLYLDKVVMRHFTPKELSKVTGYYEFVQSCLGGVNFPLGRVKATLARLYARETAKKASENLKALIEGLKADISANIRPYTQEKQRERPDITVEPHAIVDRAGNAATQSDLTGLNNRYDKEFVWSAQARNQLLRIRSVAGEWLTLENAYRSKLTNLDKKGLHPSQTLLLDPATEMDRILTEIANTFPPDCFHGDLTTMRGVLNGTQNGSSNLEVP